jgi:hypothetical protein
VYRRRGLGRFLLLRRLCRLDRHLVLAFAEDHRDRRIDRNIGSAFGHQDLAERALVRRLDFHRRLVGFDLRNHVARFNLVALFLQPFGKVALLHRGRQRGHEHFGWHGLYGFEDNTNLAINIGIKF